MIPLQIYRRRLIPSECILLKDDTIIQADENYIITKWNTLHPKKEFHHGCSCYFLKEGIKVSKFYREDGTLLYWYCDVVEYDYNEAADILTVTDLLADVILYPGGEVHVADLDELADALERGLISSEQIATGLRCLNNLLSMIYRDKFDRLQAPLNNLGL